MTPTDRLRREVLKGDASALEPWLRAESREGNLKVLWPLVVGYLWHSTTLTYRVSTCQGALYQGGWHLTRGGVVAEAERQVARGFEPRNLRYTIRAQGPGFARYSCARVWSWGQVEPETEWVPFDPFLKDMNTMPYVLQRRVWHHVDLATGPDSTAVIEGYFSNVGEEHGQELTMFVTYPPMVKETLYSTVQIEF